MDNWIMAVGYERLSFKAARKDWLKYHVHLHSVSTAGEAIRQFSRRAYIAVIATYRTPGLDALMAFMDKEEHIPLVILAQGDGGTKFAESIIRGADTFIIDPDELIESIKANKSIINRLSVIPPQQRKALGIPFTRIMFAGGSTGTGILPRKLIARQRFRILKFA